MAGWHIKRVEQDLYPSADDWSEPREYIIYSCAALSTALAELKVIEAAERAASAERPGYWSDSYHGQPSSRIVYALDHRPVNGPDGPARRLTRRISFTITEAGN